MSTLFNRNFIGNELHKLGYESHEIAGAVITLDIHGRHLMSNILDGYAQIIRMLENSRDRENISVSTAAAENSKAIAFRTQFLDQVDVRLVALQDRAGETLEGTNYALNIVQGVATEVSKAQEKTNIEWDKHRTSRPLWTLMVPWTTVSEIEHENLQRDLLVLVDIADSPLSALNEARDHLANLGFALRAYRESVDRSREENHWKMCIGSGEDDLLLLLILKEMVEMGRKAISM
jgi:hypothetical protein